MNWSADRALVFGSTGLIGKQLVRQLVEDKQYQEVILFSRKPLESTTPKVKVVTFDFNQWEGVEQYFTPNAQVFCAIGTTKAKTPDLEEYRSIDYGIPVKLAEFAARGSCRGIFIVSALGAYEHSMNFYTKMKGEMEVAVKKRGVRETYFFRPALLLGERNEIRRGEDIGKMINAVVSPLLFGKLKKFKGVEAETVARAMIHVAKMGYKQSVVENDKILQFGES